jgi:hypothetical protein
MVATFGLGGGMAALERAVKYSKERVQFGTTLSKKQGYTHRLLVPHAVQLEAARAYIERIGFRLDTGEEDLQVEGSIAKYFATEAGDAMANDGIQAFGGYGYIREYEVEKIKRDVKILPLYEGTSEIQRNIISTFRMRETVRSKGRFYSEKAEALEKISEASGAHHLAKGMRLLNETILQARRAKLTKSQYVLFLLADMMTWCEVAEALCVKASDCGGKEKTPAFMFAASRLFAREALGVVSGNAMKIAYGCGQPNDALGEALQLLDMEEVLRGQMEDMDLVAQELVK